MAGDVGSWGITDTEAARLREYLLKGGFLWTDDHWGTEQWVVWTKNSQSVRPARIPDRGSHSGGSDFPDAVHREGAAADSQHRLLGRSGGDTSEQGADSAVPHFKVVRDPHGRIMLAMTHNTDIADSFEREADDPRYFARFSPPGYALGVDVILYALTH
jgi:hypothetical protein